MSKRLVLCLTLLGATLASLAPGAGRALADEVPADAAATVERKALHWRCWFNQHAHIHCLLDSATAEQAATAPAEAPPASLPPLVAELRNRPAAFKSVLVRIPLYSAPLDDAMAGTLASAIMCGSRSDCSVHYSSRVPDYREIATILHRHLGWPPSDGTPSAVPPERLDTVTGTRRSN